MAPLQVHKNPPDLVHEFGIPYNFTVMSPDGLKAGIEPQQLASELKSARTIVLGDLHGSYQKLIETLVAADLIDMPKAQAQHYLGLANSPGNFSDHSLLLSILDKALQFVIPSIRWKGGDRQLILIGDVLSDRGPLDTVTLSVIEHISQQAPNAIVRMASNHDHNVLGYLLDEKSFLGTAFVSSMLRACDVATENKQFGDLAQKYFRYLLQSKLLHFDSETKTLFAHAPITEAQLKGLEPLLEAFQTRSPEQVKPQGFQVATVSGPKDVEHFVSQANLLYQEYVVAHLLVYRAFVQNQDDAEQKRAILKQYENCVEPVLSGEEGFLWVRGPLNQAESLPFSKAGVKTLVHGHDPQSAYSPFSLRKSGERAGRDYVVANLDQNVRKGNDVPPNEESVIFRIP